MHSIQWELLHTILNLDRDLLWPKECKETWMSTQIPKLVSIRHATLNPTAHSTCMHDSLQYYADVNVHRNNHGTVTHVSSYHSLSYLTVVINYYPFNNPLSALSSKLHMCSTQHDSIISSYSIIATSFIVIWCWKISLTRVGMLCWVSSKFGHRTSPPDGMLPKLEPIRAEIWLISWTEVCSFCISVDEALNIVHKLGADWA